MDTSLSTKKAFLVPVFVWAKCAGHSGAVSSPHCSKPMNLVSHLTLLHTERMKVIDPERLDKIRASLEGHGIDTNNLPEPDSEAWDALVRQIGQRDLALAQEFISLAYDPAEQANREMIEEQARRASMGKRGVLNRLQTVTTTKTVNGDKVPDTKLVRNVLVGAGVLAVAGVLLWPAPAAKEEVKTTTKTTTATPKTSQDDKAAEAGTKATKPDDTIPTPEEAGAKPNSTVAANPLGLPDAGTTSGTESSSASSSPAPDSTLYVPPAQPQAQYAPQPTPSYDSATPSYDSGAASGGSETLYVPPASTPAPAPVTLTENTGTSSTQSETPNTLVVPPPTPVSASQTATEPTLQATSSPVLTEPKPALVQNNAQGGNAASGDKVDNRARPALVQNNASSGAEAQKPQLVQAAAQNASQKPALVQSQASSGSGETARRTGLLASGAGGQGSGQVAGGQGSGTANQPAQANAAGQGQSYGLMQTQSQNAGQAQDSRKEYGLQQGNPSQGQGQQVQATVSGSGPASAVAAGAEKKYGLMSMVSAAAPQGAVQGAQAVQDQAVAAAPAVKFPYVMGQTLKATLMTGTGVVDGASNPVPVYAQAEDGSVWRGIVSLDGRKRLQIAFNAVAKDGTQFDVSAYAYSPADGMAALPVKITATAPNAAYDIFNGIARGAQTFAQAMLNQKTVTYQQNVPGSAGTTTTNATPNFWLTAGAGLIGSFAVPEMKSSVVMVGQLPAKTPLHIVVNGSGNGFGQTQ